MADVLVQPPLGTRESPFEARARALMNILGGNTSIVFGPRGPRLRDVTGKQAGDLAGSKGRFTPLPPIRAKQVPSINDVPAPYDVPVAPRYEAEVKPSPPNANARRALEALTPSTGAPPLGTQQERANATPNIDPLTGRPRSAEVWRRFNQKPLQGFRRGLPPDGAVGDAGGAPGSAWFRDYANSLTPEQRAAALERVNATLPASIRQSELKAAMLRGERINTANRGNLQSYTHNAARPVVSDVARIALGINAPPVQYNMPNRGAPIGGGPARIGEQVALADNLDRAANRQAVPVATDNARAALAALSGGVNRGNADFRAARATSLPAGVSPTTNLRGTLQNNMRERFGGAAAPEPSAPEPVHRTFDPGLLAAIESSRLSGGRPTSYVNPDTGETKQVRSTVPLIKSDPAKLAEARQRRLDQIAARPSAAERHQNRIDMAQANAAGMSLPAYRFLQSTQGNGGNAAEPTAADLLRQARAAHALGDAELGNTLTQQAGMLMNNQTAADENQRQNEKFDLAKAQLLEDARKNVLAEHPKATPEWIEGEARRRAGIKETLGTAPAADALGPVGSGDGEAHLKAGHMTPEGMDVLNRMADNTETTNWLPDSWTWGSWHPSVVLKKAIKSRYPKLKDKDIDRWFEAWNTGLANAMNGE